jgi:hypothetical protein
MEAEFPADGEILKKVQKSRRILRQFSDSISHMSLLPGGSKEAIARAITGNLEKTNREIAHKKGVLTRNGARSVNSSMPRCIGAVGFGGCAGTRLSSPAGEDANCTGKAARAVKAGGRGRRCTIRVRNGAGCPL